MNLLTVIKLFLSYVCNYIFLQYELLRKSPHSDESDQFFVIGIKYFEAYSVMSKMYFAKIFPHQVLFSNFCIT